MSIDAAGNRDVADLVVMSQSADMDAREPRILRCIADVRKDRGTIAYFAQLDASPLTCTDSDCRTND